MTIAIVGKSKLQNSFFGFYCNFDFILIIAIASISFKIPMKSVDKTVV